VKYKKSGNRKSSLPHRENQQVLFFSYESFLKGVEEERGVPTGSVQKREFSRDWSAAGHCCPCFHAVICARSLSLLFNICLTFSS